jgi:arylsulfatase A-like enzyme
MLSSWDFDTFYRRYCETLLSVDESIGRVIKYLESNHLAEETLVLYMGNNGLVFSEHGLNKDLQSRVEDWRVGVGRILCSPLTRPFVCECHNISTMPPCRRWYPDGGNCRLSQYATASTVFDIK